MIAVCDHVSVTGSRRACARIGAASHTGNHVNRAGSRRPERGVEEVVIHGEILRVIPQAVTVLPS